MATTRTCGQLATQMIVRALDAGTPASFAGGRILVMVPTLCSRTLA